MNIILTVNLAFSRSLNFEFVLKSKIQKSLTILTNEKSKSCEKNLENSEENNKKVANVEVDSIKELFSK